MSRFGRTWWAALVVLVVNDHLLKGAGLLPGWLTGKLSDFAGLVVAPLLVAALVGTRSSGARAAAFAIAVAPFAATKLWPEAARAVEVALGAMGFSSRIWCDPTDLVALAILPLTWRLARPTAAPPGVVRPVPILIGAFACMATSRAVSTPVPVTAAFMVNSTPEPVEVRVYRTDQPLDCSQVGAASADAMRAVYQPGFCATLRPTEVVSLDRRWQRFSDPSSKSVTPPRPGEPTCEAAILRAAGLLDTLLVWQRQSFVPIPPSHEGEALDPHGIYLERAGAQLFAAGTPLVASMPVTVPLPQTDCAAFPALDPVPTAPDAGDAGGGQ